MKEIPLTQGKVALVDDSDYAAVSAFKWCAAKDGNVFYAVRTIWGPLKSKSIRMHRVILGASKREKVDHENGDGLDNRRKNLRLASTQQNGQNQRKFFPASSRLKGVWWARETKKWRAQIQAGGTRRSLGSFNTETEAAKAYDRAAREFNGRFAGLNFPV